MANINPGDLLKKMAFIRAFENKLLALFAEGKLHGTTHTCIGQEACAAALYANLDPTVDLAFSNHRCHGHFLASGGSPEDLLAEIMGRRGAACNGRGGSQHLCTGRFFTQGIQGQSVPIAVGCAWRKKHFGESGIVVVHIGDGTLGQGVLYESLNIASLLCIPILVVLENNGVAQSTDTSDTIAGDMMARLSAFGIQTDRRRVHDPTHLARHFADVVAHVREGRPFIQVLDTFRLMAHSKGDDSRDADRVKQGWENDWLENLLRGNDAEAIEAMAVQNERMESIALSVENRPLVELGNPDVFAPHPSPLITSSADVLAKPGQQEIRINQLLNRVLGKLMEEIDNVCLIGEDIADPYGGAFKVADGLSEKFPDRIFSSPISEAAIAGMGIGWAMSGGRAVVEIMFGDFVMLAADQIVNQAAKMYFMYAGQVRIPLTIRLVSGGYRGYGPTHSQSLESLFCGVPGLKTVILSRRHDPEVMLRAAVEDPNPVLFVENKILYTWRPKPGAPDGFRFVPVKPNSNGFWPELMFTTADPGEHADMTVVTCGGMTDMVEDAMESLILNEETDFDYIVLSQLSPASIDTIVKSVRSTGKLVFVEEGHVHWGVGSEIVAAAVQALPNLPFACRRVGARASAIPCARNLENEILPSADDILGAMLEIME